MSYNLLSVDSMIPIAVLSELTATHRDLLSGETVWDFWDCQAEPFQKKLMWCLDWSGSRNNFAMAIAKL